MIAAAVTAALAASPIVPVPTLPVGSSGAGSDVGANIAKQIIEKRGSEEHNHKW